MIRRGLVAVALLGSLIVSLGAGAAIAGERGAVKFPASTHAVVNKVQVFARPTASSKRVMTLKRFRKDYKPTVFYVLGEETSKSGKRFLEISRPYRPNNRTGWVRASQLGGLHTVHTQITVDRSKRKLTLRKDGRKIFHAPVAVGKPGAPTPLGDFYLMAGFKPSLPILGAYAFETSAGAKITDWPGGGIVGLHGTDQPELIGQDVSHGCIRMKNKDIKRLKKKVKPGTGLRIIK